MGHSAPLFGVRGSPLVRFFILLLALAATGAGVMRVTSARASGRPLATAKAAETSTAQVPFRLLLSAPARSVKIDTGKSELPLTGGFGGMLELDTANPRVGLTVQWEKPVAAGEHRFAKLTLEVPGQETLTHVFDADGDIDDLLELPLPAPGK